MIDVELMLTGIQQGLILALIAFAVMIPFRLLDFPDLSAEGAYPLGGAVCAIFLVLDNSAGLALLFAGVSGGILGALTGMIHLRLQVNTLLAGIILSSMAYSINLRLMKKPNIALFNHASVFQSSLFYNIAKLSIFLAIFSVLFAIFLKTKYGLKFRAVGFNVNFAKKCQIPISFYTISGLFLAGSISGLAGGLIVQLQNYMDIGLGFGIVIHGLAALMLGETILGNHTMCRQLCAPLLGALVYQQIQGLILSIGLPSSDLKLFTGCLLLLILTFRCKSFKEYR